MVVTSTHQVHSRKDWPIASGQGNATAIVNQSLMHALLRSTDRPQDDVALCQAVMGSRSFSLLRTKRVRPR